MVGYCAGKTWGHWNYSTEIYVMILGKLFIMLLKSSRLYSITFSMVPLTDCKKLIYIHQTVPQILIMATLVWHQGKETKSFLYKCSWRVMERIKRRMLKKSQHGSVNGKEEKASHSQDKKVKRMGPGSEEINESI